MASETKKLLDLTVEITKSKIEASADMDTDTVCEFMKKVHETLSELHEKTAKLYKN